MATSVLKLQGLPALSAGSRPVSGGKPKCFKFSQSLRSRSLAAKRHVTKQILPVVCEAAGSSVAGKEDANWVPVIPIGGAKGQRRLVRQDGETILLPRYRNEIYAIENSSPADPKTGQGREWYPKNQVLRDFTKSLRDTEGYSVTHTTADQSYSTPDKAGPAIWDVVGLGQAMVSLHHFAEFRSSF